MPGFRWTREQERIMWEMRGERKTVPQIAAAIGKTSNAVYLRFKGNEGSWRKQSKGCIVERKCLGCLRPFPSEGIHNRMCPTCKAAA